MELLRRLILPAFLGPWLGVQIYSLMAGHGLDLAVTSLNDVLGLLIPGVIAAGGLLAIVIPLALFLSERALPVAIRTFGIVAAATLAGMLIVSPFVLRDLFVGGDVVGCLGVMALFGGLPAVATALVWCALNPDYLRTHLASEAKPVA